ncbi:MAG: 2-oxo acid dehydrogenase subunit E2 [Lentisphaerae bacterium]|nr:2-oxo acid dehydrogenase subunit E2 [Lentisphaerota bacterium]
MPHAIVMPKPGQFTEECTILRWLKKEGDPVAKGDVLFEIETDKANMEVESFFEGTLLKILVPVGGTVPVQATVAFVGQPGEAIPAVVAPPPPPPKPAETPAVSPAAAPAAAAPVPAAVPLLATPIPASVAPSSPTAPAAQKISPRARRLSKESAIDPSGIRGTGPGGRVLEKDVKAHLEQRGYARIRITPAAKELAIAEKIDILAVRGSGEGGRIGVEDIRRAVDEKPKVMSRMRQVIAQRLTQSFTSTPHFFVTVPVDMTDLIALRREMKDRGAPYSVTDFIVQAVVLTLKEFPAFNSGTDGRSVWWRSKVNLGLAVSLENGLVVPVVRDADDLSLAELHDRAAALVGKARDGKLAPDEMSGGTFTISNMGMLDVENFTAIINPGEAGILAVSSTRETPVVRDGRIAIRSVMKITVSADHRVVDGSVAAGFVNAIRAKLEDAALWRRLA